MTPGIVDKYDALTGAKHKTSPMRAIGLAQGLVGSFHDQTPKAENQVSKQKSEQKPEEESDDASDIDTE